MEIHNFSGMIAPCIALVALTFWVCALGFRQRITEIRTRRIHPQKLATSGQRQTQLQDTCALDNMANLFELPVLFYVCCICITLCKLQSSWLCLLAWCYVVLRGAHSCIHLGYNKVLHRFYAWATSTVCLAVMWIGFAYLYFFN